MTSENKNLQRILFTLLAFGIFFLIDEVYFRSLRKTLYSVINQLGISHIIAYIIVGIPIFLTTYYFHRSSGFLVGLGLDKPIVKAMVFAFICTLPMFIGFPIFFEYEKEFSLDTFLVTVIAAAFFEELYFRGYLFGQIFRFSNWGFIPAVILGSILFGVVHLYQGTSFDELTGIFLITFSGAVLYAWVFVEWNYNLWVPIFLHLFMNLSWGICAVSDNAAGGLYANLFRAMTIFLIIFLTLKYKKRLGEQISVNRNTLWMKRTIEKIDF